jgi:hypothetical protein
VLEATLDVSVDEVVTFSYRVRNDGEESVTLEFPTSQRVEIEVTGDDELVWRFSDGRMFSQVLGEADLPPGESVAYEGVWEGSAEGSYVAVASLAASDVDAEARAAFEI